MAKGTEISTQGGQAHSYEKQQGVLSRRECIKHSSLESRSRHPCHDLVTRIDIFVCLAMPVQVSDTRCPNKMSEVVEGSQDSGSSFLANPSKARSSCSPFLSILNVKDSAAPWPQTSMEVPSTSPCAKVLHRRCCRTARWFSEGELGSKRWPPNVALCE
ncbi:hypothetical protein M438DRAFT_32276 [Aureobasidium pullulans EXF-150]|uniref:Uncharacterized protein n=1 Tax=Aureobasidium pullulans EXF-150 TaxID=1043002 RepID=A0A074Y973_AURPU|nr:uncharacterized protein M438DRAFT_32276 [Aureobasidium pullulans EXF-150]KEQ83406.1 hypothetical protein M438DRAFT_32276 [Aureobasidium pullulans EXF-150]